MKTILLIDDSHTLQTMVSAILSAESYRVLTADDGAKGLDVAFEKKPDLILLDRRMPVMDGEQVLKELKANRELKAIPVIMLTGDKEIKNMGTSLELGAQDYIVKPFAPYDLLMRIDKLLNTGKRFWQKPSPKSAED